MVTGASTADLAIVLVDARNGVVEQTKRHAFIASLLGIPHVVVAVNKMDLVDYDEEVFDRIVARLQRVRRGASTCATSPTSRISALHGDNVVDRSEAMGWYAGLPLLEHLETVQIAADRNLDELRFPVQWVIRDHATDYRGYAGQLAGGVVRPGDEVLVLPSGQTTTVAAIDTFDGPLDEAVPPLSVTLRLADDVDVSRGDLICGPDDRAVAGARARRPTSAGWPTRRCAPAAATSSSTPRTPSRRWSTRSSTASTSTRSTARARRPSSALNDIGRVRLRTSRPLAFDAYARNRATGCFILIDEATNDTVGAGMIVPAPARA